jgi:hypothetical protein
LRGAKLRFVPILPDLDHHRAHIEPPRHTVQFVDFVEQRMHARIGTVRHVRSAAMAFHRPNGGADRTTPLACHQATSIG